MPLYEEKLINPLAVRFSQDRIWPDFQDGHCIEDSLGQVSTLPLAGTYDLVLKPPFPPIEVIRWSQERREDDGERVRDEKGRRQFGEESWFTFDNRRLYCLQRAALRFWPMVVAIVVKVLFDFPAVRCARHKFRTTSDGCAVKISLPNGEPGALWSWQDAISSGGNGPQGDWASVLEAVRRDTCKTGKDLLVDVPERALLSPGTRETTVAERFNLGASRNQNNSEGKAAGQQLLGLLKGTNGSTSSSSNVNNVNNVNGSCDALLALFSASNKPNVERARAYPPIPLPHARDSSWAHQNTSGGKGSNRGSWTQRRRKPKGQSKGANTAN